MNESAITVELIQQQDYRFDIHFGQGIPVVVGDEPPPLGTGRGPSPVQLLCLAVGNCLSDSFLFALRTFKQARGSLLCVVRAEVGRNAENKLRVLHMAVSLHLEVPGAQLAHLERALSQFKAFCTATQSVSAGIPVTLHVFDSSGTRLK